MTSKTTQKTTAKPAGKKTHKKTAGKKTTVKKTTQHTNAEIAAEWVSKISKNLFPGEGGRHGQLRYLGYTFYSACKPIAIWADGVFKISSKPASMLERQRINAIASAISAAGYKARKIP